MPDSAPQQTKPLPPCRGKVGMGVELWQQNVSTPTLPLSPARGRELDGEVIVW